MPLSFPVNVNPVIINMATPTKSTELIIENKMIGSQRKFDYIPTTNLSTASARFLKGSIYSPKVFEPDMS